MDLYSLPEWNFVGGEYQKRVWTLYDSDGKIQDLATAEVFLAIDHFVNPSGTPFLRKSVAVEPDEEGRNCNVVFVLEAEDTKNLAGTYFYQITIRQGSKAVIPLRGMMHIAANIDKEALA